jgi:pre-mRNA-splicing factor 38A
MSSSECLLTGHVHGPTYLCRYLRALAALYIRLTFRAVDVYEVLEPLLKDYRKLRYREKSKHLRTIPVQHTNSITFS